MRIEGKSGNELTGPIWTDKNGRKTEVTVLGKSRGWVRVEIRGGVTDFNVRPSHLENVSTGK